MADYLLSQSNAIAAIDAGRTSAAALKAETLEETGAFFGDPGSAADVVFGIRLWTALRHRQ
jgi:hypothetical protein